ncbi:MAG TPA: VOC family protein [Gammaproteobacteria bacterium]|nr:VOC family protein [Gammaproteobacteria bacterium]
MRELGFGQPMNGVMQMAYVVEDIRVAIDEWIRRLNVGPWFLLEHFTGEHPVYRGRPSRADVAIAMAFTGHMNIELIRPNDAEPSVYKEAIEARGYGFHHFGLASEDVEADVERYLALGMEVAYRVGVPTGGDVVYMDARGAVPGFVELIPTTPLMDEAFTGFYRASVGWNGADPIRPFL